MKLFFIRSFSTKLTLLYTFATFFLLGGIAIVLYLAMGNMLQEANRQFIMDQMSVLQYIIKNNPNNISMLRQEIITSPHATTDSMYRYYIRLVDNTKKSVLQTPGMDSIVKKTAFFNQTQSKPVLESYSVGDEDYMFMQAPAFSSKNSAKKEWIQIALDVSHQDKLVDRYEKIFMIALSLELIFAILIGYFISRRAASGLSDLVSTAKNITANSLQKRIDPDCWPRELRTLGVTFNEMIDRIERAFARLSQFSADLAHELRTPLHNLMGEADLVLSRSASEEEYRKVIESSLEEYQRLSQTIENLLFLAQVENPKYQLKKDTLQMRSEIEKIGDFYRPLAEEKNIILAYQGNASVKANSILFGRVVSNILINAIKHIDHAGEIKFVMIENENSVTLQIHDTGSGISAEHLPKITDRFYRAHSSQADGAGLGLAIVKSIMDLHGGSLDITSQLHQGTCVVLVFPK